MATNDIIDLDLPERRTLAPQGNKAVKFWALLGACFLAIFAYTWARWLLSGVQTTPNGPTHQPGWQVGFLHCLEAASIAAFVVSLYVLVIRPWRRDGVPTTYGLLFLGGLGAYWQDQGYSYFKIALLYNTHFVQFGSWYNFIPGFMADGVERVPSPILFVWPMYGLYFVLGGLLGSYVMGRAKARWPDMGRLGLCFVAWVVVFILEVIVEAAWLRTTMYTFPTTSGPTLFQGHFYQLPLTFAFLFSLMWAAWGPFFYFRDDRGYTLVERGIDRVKATPRQKALLRVLAMCAAVNLVYGGLNVTYAIVAAHGGPWPQDVIKRSYLTGGLCGPGTTLACPDGDLVVSPGSKLPEQE